MFIPVLIFTVDDGKNELEILDGEQLDSFRILLWKSEPLSDLDEEEESNAEVSPFSSVKMESAAIFADANGAAVADELENNRC